MSDHPLDRGHWSPGRGIAEKPSYSRWYDVRFMGVVEAVGRLSSVLLDDLDPNSPWSHEEIRDAVKTVQSHVDDWLKNGFPFPEEE